MLRYATLVRWAALIAVPGTLSVPLLVAFAPPMAGAVFGIQTSLIVDTRTPAWAVALLEAPSAIALATAFAALADFLGRAVAGAALSRSALVRVRTFAVALVAVAVLDILKVAAMAALQSPPGSLVVQLTVTGAQLTSLIVASTVLIIASVLHEAGEIKRDYDTFI